MFEIMGKRRKHMTSKSCSYRPSNAVLDAIDAHYENLSPPDRLDLVHLVDKAMREFLRRNKQIPTDEKETPSDYPGA